MPPEVDDSEVADLAFSLNDEDHASVPVSLGLLSASDLLTSNKEGEEPSPPSSRRGMKRYTIAEVATHNTKNDAWLIYNDKVLDVSKWITSHPGGEQAILRFAGMDATDELRAFHDDWVLETKLPHFIIGTTSDAPPTSELVLDFRKLGEEFEKLGYFHVTPWFYVGKIIWVFSIFTCSMGLLFKCESFISHMMSAVLLGIFWQQFAFVGHDCGHMSARTHARDNIDVNKLGALVTFFNGISVAWWKATHNVHHAVPNTVDCDPDIAHLPVFAVDKQMFGSLFNKYHGRVMEFDWAARNIFVPYQHIWYYPIMCVARFNLYIQSVLFLMNPNDGHGGRTKLDAAAFIGFFSWLTVLVSSISTWKERVAYVLLSHAMAGLLNVQITLSHFSREIFDSATKENGKEKYGGDFFSRNVKSSLDVICPTYLDWFHGGLQFQTLHHLYPRIGRQHLRKTMPLIKSLCKKHSLPYSDKSFVNCNLEIIETLKNTGFESRSWSPLIYESMCAQG
jgi:cytochrome b involved in lipid metabolism/fatty acid desaturase